jgi:hypothetical protein
MLGLTPATGTPFTGNLNIVLLLKNDSRARGPVRLQVWNIDSFKPCVQFIQGQFALR